MMSGDFRVAIALSLSKKLRAGDPGSPEPPGFSSGVAFSGRAPDAANSARWVEVVWADGASARFHHVWLRDNCACDLCVHPITKEQTFELVSAPAINPARAASVTGLRSGSPPPRLMMSSSWRDS
jgi:hypothetical protein